MHRESHRDVEPVAGGPDRLARAPAVPGWSAAVAVACRRLRGRRRSAASRRSWGPESGRAPRPQSSVQPDGGHRQLAAHGARGQPPPVAAMVAIVRGVVARAQRRCRSAMREPDEARAGESSWSSTGTTICRGRCARSTTTSTAVDIARPQPQLHTDLPRLRAGGVGAQFWSVFVPCTFAGADAVTRDAGADRRRARHDRAVSRRPGAGHHAPRAGATLADGGRIGCLLGAEGGHSIDNSLGVLRTLYRLGVRYLTLTHNENTAWADSATDAPDARRPDRLRPGGGRGDQPARHAGRPVPRRGRHDARRARRHARRR